MAWRRDHPDFVVGVNEAGMILGEDVRAADGAVWRRDALGRNTGGFPRVAPILAVEIAGRDDTVELLRDKARWYLGHAVAVVWILIPATRSALVVTALGESAVPPEGRIPAHPDLPGLEPSLRDLFRQAAGG
jgi:Uma2 family endonuclease